VLVVDDDEAARYVLRQFLAGSSCEVAEARHGGEALDSIAAERPDAVLLDLDMPGTDGFAALERIAAGDPSLPVFVVTSAALDDALLRRLGGARAVLAKRDLSSEALLKLLDGEFGFAAAEAP
jgi:CheY-like chemotaxis protein